jgi:hypothetical protein
LSLYPSARHSLESKCGWHCRLTCPSHSQWLPRHAFRRLAPGFLSAPIRTGPTNLCLSHLQIVIGLAAGLIISGVAVSLSDMEQRCLASCHVSVCKVTECFMGLGSD